MALRPAPATRQWMDETSEAFAYRCLPLNIANAHGWEILAPAAFSARWTGGDDLTSIDIRCAAEQTMRPTSIFGHGVLTFHVGGVFRTEPGWNLHVGGSPNHPKDGICPLTGVIETDWAPYSFTMNWRFTRPDHWVSFDEGEPFCYVFPVQRGVLEPVQPEIRDMASSPQLQAEFTAWTEARRSFIDHSGVLGSPEARMRWQKYYYRGLTMRGEPGVKDHQAKLRLAEFVDNREKPAATEPKPLLPTYYSKVVPLSRAKHARLGLREGNYAFAATTPIIHLAAAEFPIAAQTFPLAFTDSNPPRAICVAGTLPGINLHVDEAGNWRSGAYIPAAVRRFPFITMTNREQPDVLTLGIEEGSALLDAEAPAKLFEHGEMTALCRQRLGFAAKLAQEFEATESLCDQLLANGLLMAARAVVPPRLAGRSLIRELRVIDPERLDALPAKLREVWQANGWLAALTAHVNSAPNWQRLLALEDEMAVAQPKETAHPA